MRKLPERLTPPDEENIPGPPGAGEETDWYPEDATVKVWSTENGDPSDFLVAALHENEIRCRVEKNGQRAELYVLPEDESTRAGDRERSGGGYAAGVKAKGFA